MDYCRTITLLVLFIFAQLCRSADPNADIIAKMEPVAPCASLVASARANHIPLEQIDASGETNALHAGDSVTALVTLFEKGGIRTQWIVYIEAAVPESKETVAKKPGPLVLYSSFGGKFEFASAPAPVKLRTFGPFAETPGKKKLPKPEEIKARFSVDAAFLGLGLEQAAAVMWRLKQMTKNEGYLGVSVTPLPENALEKGRKLAVKLKMTLPEERALVASIPALFSYVGIIQQTEGLKDILSELVELPSVWSMVRHAGVNAEINYERDHLAPATSTEWSNRTDEPLFFFPLRLGLNGEPALKITLLVTSPRPPLLACGGVVGLLAEKVADKECYMTLRILSARTAKSQNTAKQ